MHRVKEWWSGSPLGIIVGSLVALAAACLVFWGYFSSKPPIPVVIDALRAAEAMPSVAQLAGLAMMALASGVQVALFVALIRRHRAEDKRLHEDLGVVVRELQGLTGREEDLRAAVAVLRSLAEPNEVLMNWRRQEEELRAGREAEESERGKVRNAANLRALRESEVGLELRELPSGIHCFVETLPIVEHRRIPRSRIEPVFRGDLRLADRLWHAPALASRSLPTEIEVHLDPSGHIFLVGFTPELDATRIESGRAESAPLYLSRASHAPRAARVDAERVDRAISASTTPPRLDLQLTPPEDPPPTTVE